MMRRGHTVWNRRRVSRRSGHRFADKDTRQRRIRRPYAMSYVQSVLQPGEHVRYATNLHWTIYLPGLLLLVLAALVFWFGHTWLTTGAGWIWDGLAALVFACAAVLLFMAWFRRWTTEIAVTDRRIIYKDRKSTRLNSSHIPLS